MILKSYNTLLLSIIGFNMRKQSKGVRRHFDEVTRDGVEEYHMSYRRSTMNTDKDLRDFQNGCVGVNLDNFDGCGNFSTTFSQDISCKEFGFSLNPGDKEFYFEQLHKIVWYGEDTTEYQCLKMWYDDVKFEEIKAFLMSKPQKDKTKVLIRELKEQLKKIDCYYNIPFPLQTLMYHVEGYKNRFVYNEFCSFKKAFMYDFNCDRCGTCSHYLCPDSERFKFKVFLTSRRKDKWYQCMDSIECDCKEGRDTYYDYCEDCFFKLPNTVVVIKKRLLSAFLAIRWGLPDELIKEFCPPISDSL